MNKPNQNCGGLESLQPLKPEDLEFTFKSSNLPKPNREFVKKLRGEKGVVPFPFVLLIEEPQGHFEVLNTNIPNFKLRTQKPFQMIKAK